MSDFNYQMLGKLVRDCEYCLGSAQGNLRHLHHDNVADQITAMKELHNGFPLHAKPEWLSMAEIAAYEEKLSWVEHYQDKQDLSA
jgi:hypothetical protein